MTTTEAREGATAMRIADTRHTFGTADVFVEGAEIITAPSQSAGVLTSVVPDTFYIDDAQHAGDWWLTVVVNGRTLRKDGSPSARSTRVTVPPAKVPAEVREALAIMRPDLAAWLLG